MRKQTRILKIISVRVNEMHVLDILNNYMFYTKLQKTKIFQMNDTFSLMDNKEKYSHDLIKKIVDKYCKLLTDEQKQCLINTLFSYVKNRGDDGNTAAIYYTSCILYHYKETIHKAYEIKCKDKLEKINNHINNTIKKSILNDIYGDNKELLKNPHNNSKKYRKYIDYYHYILDKIEKVIIHLVSLEYKSLSASKYF